MSDNIRVGLIGYGYASKTFHAPLIAGTPGLELAVISSSDETKVKADWPTVTVVSEPKHLFNDPNIDLIVIPTPNDTHFPLAKAALEAGKHVVVDKPFTVTLSQARELDALAKSLGRVLSVFHNRRWDSDFLTLKGLLAEGVLGEVAYFESHFDRFRPQVRDRWREQGGPGSGIWYDLAPHLLDQAITLFGLPVSMTVDLAHVDYMVESIVSLTHEAFGQRALVVEIMAEGMRNPQVAAMLKNKHMTITEFVAQRMRDAQQKGEISPDINTSMTSRLLLDLTYGVLADIEAEDLAREASFAQGLRAMIGGILTAS